jgi:hypothetical protein
MRVRAQPCSYTILSIGSGNAVVYRYCSRRPPFPSASMLLGQPLYKLKRIYLYTFDSELVLLTY